MKKYMIVGVAALLVAMLAPAAMADKTDTQVVNFEVKEIQQINVADAPVSLTITAATAGQDPDDATAASSYSITVNSNSDRKITGAIDSNMPGSVTLEVALVAPAVGVTAGSKALSTAAVELVTGISKIKGAGLGMAYTLSATAEDGVVSGSRTVTYTIIN